MIQKLKNKLLALSAVFLILIPVAIPAMVSAADISNSVCTGADKLAVTDSPNGAACSSIGTTNGQDKVNTLITQIINIFSVIVGVVAVIMIIVAGFRYITSGGKQESVTGAKNTILYAIIGLVVVALAQIIVRFVLSKTTS